MDLRRTRSVGHATLAVLIGIALGVSVSGGILEERLTGGRPEMGLGVNALMTAVAVALLYFSRRKPPLENAFSLHAFGAFAGIVLVHVALRAGFIDGAPWLLERPAQLMNDGVAALATLGIVWACARGLDLRVLLAVLVATSLYRATGAWWHLDRAPHGFAMTVQDLTFMQLVAMALALPIYQRLGLRPDQGGQR